MTLRVLPHPVRARTQRALRRGEIARLAEQKPSRQSMPAGDAVAGWNGLVAEGLAAMDEPLVIGRSEIKSAAVRIGEALQDRLGERLREFEVASRQRACRSSSSASARNA